MLRSDHGAVNSSGKCLDMPSVFLQLLIALSVNSVFTDSLKLLNIKGHVILIVKTGIFFYFCWAHPPPSPLSLSILLSRCQHVKSGPPLFGLYPNGLFTFGLSLIGLQGYLDYHHLDYL